jgi:hypothetical protein
MILLFFDVYYVNGGEALFGFYEMAKDFIVLSIAMIAPIWITSRITSRDQKIIGILITILTNTKTF